MEPTSALPLVSVILPTRNRAVLLARAVKSVLAQTYANVELILIDEGSTDETPEIVKRFTDPRVKPFRNEVSRAPGAARNAGIEASEGEFVAFLDDDDEFLPNKLKDQLDMFGRSVGSVGMVISPVQMFRNGKPLDYFPYNGESGNVFLNILAGNTFPLNSILLRRNVLVPFDDKLACLEDIDFCLKVAQQTKAIWSDSPCAVVHLDDNRKRLTSDKVNLHKSFRLLQQRWFNDPDDSFLRNAQADLFVNFALRQFALGFFDPATREYLNKAYALKKDGRMLKYRLQNMAGPTVLKWFHAKT